MKKLGFGLMRLPTIGEFSEIDKEKTREMIDAFMQNGFNYFDTAHVYHSGNSEKIFGELVADRYPRDSFVLTSKMPVFRMKSKDEYPTIFKEQLERCRVEYFDYYFIHSLNKTFYEQVQKDNGFEFLIEKKKEGKIRHIGFSFHDDAETLEKIILEHPEVELVQLQINYLDWESSKVQSRKCYEVCRKYGKKIAVMEPLRGGELANLPAEANDILKSMDEKASIASWGIRFAASLEDVMVVLSGMSSMEQLCDNMSYMKDFEPLSKGQTENVHKAADITLKTILVPCTSCRYCVDDCPQNIAIPEYFNLYNSQHRHGLIPRFKGSYNNTKAKKGAPADCIECGSCESHCPQQIPIISMLRDVRKTFEENN